MVAGVLGIDPERLFFWTFRQFYWFQKGWHRQQDQEADRFRRVAYIIAKANSDPKKKFPSMDKFWPLESDRKIHILTDEEQDRIIKEFFDKHPEFK
jgi:hypothetical protein